MQAIKPVVKEQIFRSLRAGAVPRIGQQYIQVGREPEVTALIKGIDNINKIVMMMIIMTMTAKKLVTHPVSWI